MALIVKKFGGTSVGTPERIKNVARLVAGAQSRGDRVAVVVSAMSGETDRLLKLSQEVAGRPDPREQDVLVATGEQVTIALLALALRDLGCPARSFTGWQAGFLTDTDFTRARIRKVEADRVREALEAGEVAVVAGFQGITPDDEITTLGRGGSDLTAVALAAAIEADRCDIYTDVEGVFTADPNVVGDARLLGRVSYEEMLEMASLGAKVLQARSVEYAANYNVPVRVCSSFTDNPGTMVIKEDPSMEQVLVSGVTLSKNESKITIQGAPDKPGVAARVFAAVAGAGILVDLIVQNVSSAGTTDITFTVLKSDSERTKEILKPVLAAVGARGLASDDHLAKISIVGTGMRSHAGVAAKMFQALADEQINIHSIGTSEIKITCLIEGKYAELATRVLHEAFGLGSGAVAGDRDL
jgi:aspartate kinase